MKPETYREQAEKGCWSCQHCFIAWDYEDQNDYYCHIDKSKRPRCGGAGSKERFCPKEEFEKRGVTIEDIKSNSQACKDYNKWHSGVYRKRKARWEKWKKDREVSDSGICDKFKERKEE